MPQNQWMPETRRLFLQAITVGAGSFTLVPKCLLSSEKDLAPLSFIVVTDTHLGYRDNESAAKQWEQTAKEISRAKGNLVLHLGDIVDGKRESQYMPYLKTRDTIGKTIHEIPGNQNRRLEEQKAAGYNPAEFRPGFTQVSIEDGVMRLQYHPVGEESSVTHDCKLPQLTE